MSWIVPLAATTLAVVGLAVAATSSATLEGSVKDPSSKSVVDAVIFATPVTPMNPLPARKPPQNIVMEQRNRAFLPHVLPVEVGTTVRFPNHDNIKHHIYSFSLAKKFERPLYAGSTAEPVTFDMPGDVALGCNIHDCMRGHIYVLTTPYFARTTPNGIARVQNLPAGQYDVRVWHPRMRETPDATVQRTTLTATALERAAFVITLKPDMLPPCPRDEPRYRDQTSG
jgi:plastocyanin